MRLLWAPGSNRSDRWFNTVCEHEAQSILLSCFLVKISPAVTFNFRYILPVNITGFPEPTWLCCSKFRYFLVPTWVLLLCQDKFFPFRFLEQVPAFYVFKSLLSGLGHRKTSDFWRYYCVLLVWGSREWTLLPSPSQFAGNLGLRNAAGVCTPRLQLLWGISWAHTGFAAMGKTSLCYGVCGCKKKAENANFSPKIQPRAPFACFTQAVPALLFWLFQGVEWRLKPKVLKK